jgi:uncharacterized protein (DUF302 family)
MTASTNKDVVEYQSPLGFEPTLARCRDAITKAGMTVFAEIDHGAGARSVGFAMPPTVVLLYGNPKGGTPIMLAVPLAALDLPLRVLVHADEQGRTFVTFHPIETTLRRAGVAPELATRLNPAQDLLVRAIAPP